MERLLYHFVYYLPICVYYITLNIYIFCVCVCAPQCLKEKITLRMIENWCLNLQASGILTLIQEGISFYGEETQVQRGCDALGLYYK